MDCLNQLRKAASHLGMSFQIADDIEDQKQDRKVSINIVSILGEKEAISLFKKEVAAFRTSLEELKLWTEPFQELYTILSRRVPSSLFR